jgi:very-short-patch-repair endonuclease
VGVWAVANHFARHLRRNVTDAEKKLWYQLRILKSEGRHFRRQVPIAGFIADFACYKCRLIVELDGGQHSAPTECARDGERSRLLEAEGFRIMRFWNSDVFQNLEGVVDMIRNAAGLWTIYAYEPEKSEIDVKDPHP